MVLVVLCRSNALLLGFELPKSKSASMEHYQQFLVQNEALTNSKQELKFKLQSNLVIKLVAR